MIQIMYVLHSPYPNGTWRGWEKCLGSSKEGGALLFSNKEDAENFLFNKKYGECWVVWEIEINVPEVGSKLNVL